MSEKMMGLEQVGPQKGHLQKAEELKSQRLEKISQHDRWKKFEEIQAIGTKRKLAYMEEDIEKQLNSFDEQGRENVVNNLKMEDFPIIEFLPVQDYDKISDTISTESTYWENEKEFKQYVKIKIYTSGGVFELPTSTEPVPDISLANENVDCKRAMIGIDDYADSLKAKGFDIIGFEYDYYDEGDADKNLNFFIKYQE